MAVYIILIVQQLIASGTHFVAKMVAADIEPVTLTMLRSVLAATGLIVYYVIAKKRFQFERKDYKQILWLSFLAIPLNQFLFLAGMRYSTPANAALLYGTTPAIVLVVSRILGKEKITFRKALGVSTAFIGITLIVFQHGIDFHADYTYGNVLFVLAVVAWGLYTVQGRTLTLKYGAFPTSAATMIFGGVMFVPIGIFGLARFHMTTLTFGDWGELLYLAIATSILSYYLWYYALERIEASKVAIFSNIQPMITTLVAVLFFGQQLTGMFILGGLFALSGVVITQFG